LHRYGSQTGCRKPLKFVIALPRAAFLGCALP
jgi:hypothetical protein